MYSMEKLNKISDRANIQYRQEFIGFFQKHLKNINIDFELQKIQQKIVKQFIDIDKFYNNEGFYIILSDYDIQNNSCKFCLEIEVQSKIIKLRAVYRGQASHRKQRLTGHVFRDRYVGKDKNFMTIDKDNGINIDQPKYEGYTWMIISYSIPKSSQEIRVQAEKAFDMVFGKPIFSSR